MTEILELNLKNRKIDTIYQQLSEQASDVMAKINYLKRIKPKYGLAIIRYPSGTPLSLIEKVSNSIWEKLSLDGCNYIPIKTSHQSLFHLIRNGSSEHIAFEKKQSLTGGINSDVINDLGDFLII